MLYQVVSWLMVLRPFELAISSVFGSISNKSISLSRVLATLCASLFPPRLLTARTIPGRLVRKSITRGFGGLYYVTVMGGQAPGDASRQRHRRRKR